MEEVGEEREVPKELTDQELRKNFPLMDAISSELLAESFIFTALFPFPVSLSLALSSSPPLLFGGDAIAPVKEGLLEDIDIRREDEKV